MSARNRVFILLGIILAISGAYYFLSTPRGGDLVLVGTVDANQIVVSPQIQGRILKLLVDEGTQVKQGDLIAELDPSELEAEERAAAAMISNYRSQMSANEYTRKSTKGSTSSNVSNAQAQLQSARAQLVQAEATLARVESDSRRTIGLANAGVASEQEKVQAEMNLKAQQASVQSLKDQVSAAQASLNAAVARTNHHPANGRWNPNSDHWQLESMGWRPQLAEHGRCVPAGRPDATQHESSRPGSRSSGFRLPACAGGRSARPIAR